MVSISSLTLIILLLYALGVGLYYFSRGWFRTTLLSLGAIIGVPYAFILIATSGPSPSYGGDPYAGFGLGLLLMFASAPGMPAAGILMAMLGDKIAEFTGEKTRALMLKALTLATFPILLFYLFEFAPNKRRSNTLELRLHGNYAVKLGDTYLTLPCRREFHIFKPVRKCTLTEPKLLSDFVAVVQLKIWPKGHPDTPHNCSAPEVEREKSARFCDIKFLPYNINLIGSKSKIEDMEYHRKRVLEYHRKRVLGEARDDQGRKNIGNLQIMREIEQTYTNARPTSIKYDFQKDSIGSTAHLYCHNNRGDRTLFECNMDVNYEDKILADDLRFKAELDQIEAEVDRITGEVAAYYTQFVETYGVQEPVSE